jgi:hypothetical protein
MGNIETSILEQAITSLNSLEGGSKSVDIVVPTEVYANYLKEYLSNYNVEIGKSLVKNWSNLKVSKKEKK